MSYCENCGKELTSLFCETCGAISSNIPTSLSNDESLAGLLANIIRQGKQITFTQVQSITKSVERSYRIFSQLEKTKNFLITNEENEFIISFLPNSEEKNITFGQIDKRIKLYLLTALLELFPLSLEELSELVPMTTEREEIVKSLTKKYRIKDEGPQKILQKME